MATDNAHKWAHQIVNKRSKTVEWGGSSLSVSGKCIYSYSTVIGELVTDDHGETIAMLNVTRYSNTTDRHQWDVRSAVRHMRTLPYYGRQRYTYGMPSTDSKSRDFFLDQCRSYLKKYHDGKFYDESLLNEAANSFLTAMRYDYHFGNSYERITKRDPLSKYYRDTIKAQKGRTSYPHEVLTIRFRENVHVLLNMTQTEFFEIRNASDRLREKRQAAARKAANTRAENERRIREQRYAEYREKHAMNNDPTFYEKRGYTSLEAYLDAWRAGTESFLPTSITRKNYETGHLIGITSDGRVKTSGDAYVPMDKELFLQLHKIIESGAVDRLVGRHIGSFTIREYKDEMLVVGCHRFTKTEIDKFIATCVNT